jgi:hypothetical protein
MKHLSRPPMLCKESKTLHYLKSMLTVLDFALALALQATAVALALTAESLILLSKQILNFELYFQCEVLISLSNITQQGTTLQQINQHCTPQIHCILIHLCSTTMNKGVYRHIPTVNACADADTQLQSSRKPVRMLATAVAHRLGLHTPAEMTLSPECAQSCWLSPPQQRQLRRQRDVKRLGAELC